MVAYFNIPVPHSLPPLLDVLKYYQSELGAPIFEFYLSHPSVAKKLGFYNDTYFHQLPAFDLSLPAASYLLERLAAENLTNERSTPHNPFPHKKIKEVFFKNYIEPGTRPEVLRLFQSEGQTVPSQTLLRSALNRDDVETLLQLLEKDPVRQPSLPCFSPELQAAIKKNFDLFFECVMAEAWKTLRAAFALKLIQKPSPAQLTELVFETHNKDRRPGAWYKNAEYEGAVYRSFAPPLPFHPFFL